MRASRTVRCPTVRKWRQRFLDRGLDGLLDEPRPGTPRKLSDPQVEQVLNRTLKARPKRARSGQPATWGRRAQLIQPSAASGAAFASRRIASAPFKLSPDPLLIENARDIVGLYLAPPDRALVLCVDEKSQIHALPNLPVAALRPDQRSAAPTATPATVRPAEKNVPEALDVPLILDIYGTHKTKLLRDWLAKRPRFHGRFTPTSAFWLNLVRHWFALLTETETPGLTTLSQAFAVRKEQQISSGNYKKQRNSRFPSE